MNIGPWRHARGFRVGYRTPSQIRALARSARTVLGVPGGRINMGWLLENALRKQGIHFHIVSPEQIPEDAARAEPETGRILLTEPAYEAMCDDDPEHQLLVPHEIAHFALEHNVTFSRTNTDGAHTALADSEVQADLFSHEFAMPVELVRRYCVTVADIARAFNVPKKDARIRADLLRQDGIIILG